MEDKKIEELKKEITHIKEKMEFHYFEAMKNKETNRNAYLYHLAQASNYLETLKEKEKELEELKNKN